MNCRIDPEKLSIIAECMETYAMEYRDPSNEWVWNIVSRKAVVYSCGMIGRNGDQLPHDHDHNEIALCHRLSQEAASIVSGHLIGMGDENDHNFLPFYIVAQRGDEKPTCVNAEVIHMVFGGTLYPHSDITFEPLNTDTEWYSHATEIYEDDDDKTIAEQKRKAKALNRLIDWFGQQQTLYHPIFVSIDIDDVKDIERYGLEHWNGAAVFPRLIVAWTTSGSLVGLFSCVAYS